MPAFADLKLSAGSPAADVTFNPTVIDSAGVAKWLGVDVSSLDLKPVITMSTNLPKGGSPVVRIKQRILIPIADTVDASKKKSEAYADIQYVIPKDCPLAVRGKLRDFVLALTSHANSIAAVTNFESTY